MVYESRVYTLKLEAYWIAFVPHLESRQSVSVSVYLAMNFV